MYSGIHHDILLNLVGISLQSLAATLFAVERFLEGRPARAEAIARHLSRLNKSYWLGAPWVVVLGVPVSSTTYVVIDRLADGRAFLVWAAGGLATSLLVMFQIWRSGRWRIEPIWRQAVVVGATLTLIWPFMALLLGTGFLQEFLRWIETNTSRALSTLALAFAFGVILEGLAIVTPW